MPATFLGMALAVGSLVAMMLLEGSSPLAVVLLPPLILVFGGTFGAAVAGLDHGRRPQARLAGSGMAFGPDREPATQALIAQLVELATMARKEGMLPLENRARVRRGPVPAPRAAAGRSTACRSSSCGACWRARSTRTARRRPGRRPLLRQDGRLRADHRHHRHRRRAGAGAAEPRRTRRCSARSSPRAFVATLWGVLSANFIWLPMSAKIRRNSDLRAAQMTAAPGGRDARSWPARIRAPSARS